MIETLEQLDSYIKKMSKKELIKILHAEYVNFKNNEANKLKFIFIDEKYYISYDMLFYNLAHLATHNNLDFANKFLIRDTYPNLMSEYNEYINTIFTSLYQHYNIVEQPPEREYRIISVHNFTAKINLLQIPYWIVLIIQKEGILFLPAIDLKNSSIYKMSYKEIKYDRKLSAPSLFERSRSKDPT